MSLLDAAKRALGLPAQRRRQRPGENFVSDGVVRTRYDPDRVWRSAAQLVSFDNPHLVKREAVRIRADPDVIEGIADGDMYGFWRTRDGKLELEDVNPTDEGVDFETLGVEGVLRRLKAGDVALLESTCCGGVPTGQATLAYRRGQLVYQDWVERQQLEAARGGRPVSRPPYR